MRQTRKSPPLRPHPMQPVVVADDNVVRFQENSIVRWLLDQASAGRKVDLNDIAVQCFADEDLQQFAQLIGYSVSGFGSLSYVSDEKYTRASRRAKKLTGRRS